MNHKSRMRNFKMMNINNSKTTNKEKSMLTVFNCNLGMIMVGRTVPLPPMGMERTARCGDCGETIGVPVSGLESALKQASQKGDVELIGLNHDCKTGMVDLKFVYEIPVTRKYGVKTNCGVVNMPLPTTTEMYRSSPCQDCGTKIITKWSDLEKCFSEGSKQGHVLCIGVNHNCEKSMDSMSLHCFHNLTPEEKGVK